VSLRRALAVLLAGVALAACLGVALVALVFALHALLEPWLGATGATALVIALVALLTAAGAVAAQLALRPRRGAAAGVPAKALVDRVLVFVRDRPVVSIAGAVGVGALAIANPIFVARLARAFMELRRPAPGG
jgi:hypothetical protein